MQAFKNFIDTLYGAIVLFFIEYPFAFSLSHEGLIGYNGSFFFGAGFKKYLATDEYLKFIFQISFANATLSSYLEHYLSELIVIPLQAIYFL